MIRALLFVFHPALPADLLDGGGHLTERKFSRAQFDVVAVLEVAHVEADDAAGMGADECGDIGAGVISMTGIENEMDHSGISLRVESFDFANLRLKFPPMIVVGEADASTLP